MILAALLAAHCSTVFGDYWHGDFVDSTTVVFSEDAILYSSPDLDSRIIMAVPICTAITVSGSAGEVLLPDGTPTYWYDVSFELPGISLEGYMPGTSLAMTSLELGSDTLFIFNVTGFNPDEYRYSASARIVESGSISEEITFRPVGGGFGQGPYSYCIRGTELDPSGLESVRNLIELSFIYEACGYPNKDILFVWTGDEFLMGPEASSQFEAGLYQYNETFITPADSSGVPGEVTVEVSSTTWDEDLGDYGETSRSSMVYSWNAQSFTLVDEGS